MPFARALFGWSLVPIVSKSDCVSCGAGGEAAPFDVPIMKGRAAGIRRIADPYPLPPTPFLHPKKAHLLALGTHSFPHWCPFWWLISGLWWVISAAMPCILKGQYSLSPSFSQRRHPTFEWQILSYNSHRALPHVFNFTFSLFSQELEDTIDSLKSQVSLLQQRAALLQDEVDASAKFSLHLQQPLGGSTNTLVSTSSLKSTSWHSPSGSKGT